MARQHEESKNQQMMNIISEGNDSHQKWDIIK